MKNVSEIVDLASAYYGSAVLFAAIDRGVFAAIEQSNNRTAESLAAACGCEERGLRLLVSPRGCWRRTARHIAIRRRGRRRWCREVRRI